MTSDRGNTGGAEMEVASTEPITPKSAGLNPNANVFHSKGPATPPESATSTEWPEADSLTTSVSGSAGSPEQPEGCTLMNGDLEKSGDSVIYPPTPESPPNAAISNDCTNMNGGLEGQVLFSPTDATPTTPNSADENKPLESSLPDDQLRAMLKHQLEYYFSRDNLASDSYLVSQMDADQYVAISTVAGFNQVKRLTNSVDLVVEVLRESSNVQVDEKGEKVRPLHKRCIVILREVPHTTPVEAVEKLFTSENCPKFISCEFAINNSWYVTFDTEDDAQRAYQYLREEIKTFLGKPIMARIKAKPLLRSTFMPNKNGMKSHYEPNVYPQKFTTYTAQQQVPNVHYVSNQPVSGNFPFFHPPTAPMSVWPTNPMTYFDPGAAAKVTRVPSEAFAANGYTPTATFKINNASNRHGFQNMRNRNQKSHRNAQNRDQSNQNERSQAFDRDRPQSVTNGMARSSPRVESSSGSGSSSAGGSASSNNNSSRRESGAQQHSSSHTHPHPEHPAAVPPAPAGTRQPESVVKETTTTPPQPQRRGGASYRSRRKRGAEEEGANKRLNPQSAKENHYHKDFEFEDQSFPPLPGFTNNTTTDEVFENKMSDVVKGTARPLTRETKTEAPTAPAAPLVSPPASQSTPVVAASTPVSSNASTNTPSAAPPSQTHKPASPSRENKYNTPPVHSLLPTPPASPQKVSKSTSTENPTIAPIKTVEPSPAAPSSSTSVSTQTASSTAQVKPEPPVSKPPVAPTAAKMSYAMVAQRGKEKVGSGNVGKTKSQEDCPPPSKDQSTCTSNGSNCKQPAGSSCPSANSNMRSPTRRDRDEAPREQRTPARRALKDIRRDPRDRDNRERDRFRDRRRPEIPRDERPRK